MIAKVFSHEGSVQLIVFFAAIRETLKKEIYGCHKRCFCAMKTKRQFDRVRLRLRPITNLTNSVCEWSLLRRLQLFYVYVELDHEYPGNYFTVRIACGGRQAKTLS